MAELKNNHDPQWLLFPVNNDRTAWRPFGLPVILVVPHRRDPLGHPFPNSNVDCIRVYIEDVPDASIVAGHDHLTQVYDKDACGNQTSTKTHVESIRFPDKELYAVTLNQEQLSQRRVAVDAVQYFHQVGGKYKPLDRPPVRGDYYKYTTSSGVTDYIPYLPDAEYYDFSDVLLDVEPLPPSRYVIVYQCEYFARQRTNTNSDELLCIDVNTTALGILRFPFNHPGEVMGEFYRHTPAVYMTDVKKSEDSTLALYRPLTDALQDIYDEQILLQQANWINRIPDQLIPYLITLLGWDLPYFPDSSGDLQRVLLKSTARLQAMKGSRQAVQEIFKLLGIDVLINNLWWSKDGKRFIRPGERLDHGYRSQEIIIRARQQIEPLLVDYHVNGAGGVEVPLLHRPQVVGGLDGFTATQDGGDLYVTTYLVEVGTTAHSKLLELAAEMKADPDGFSAAHQPRFPLYYQTGDGHLYEKDCISESMLDYYFNQHGELIPTIACQGVGSYSQVRVVKNQVSDVVGGPLGVPVSQAAVSGWADPAVVTTGVKFDRQNNRLTLYFNGYQDFSGDYDLPRPRVKKALFAFASYVRQTLAVPAEIATLQSNRFDVQLLQADVVPPLAGMYSYVNPQTMDFALELLHKVKAFHSLLNTVRVIIELNETYEVTDLCVGGDIQQRYDTMVGRLQVPPAILPKPPTEGDCTQLDPYSLGYKRSDIIFRMRKLANLPEEHAAWKSLDGPHTNDYPEGDPRQITRYRDDADVYSLVGPRIRPQDPAPGREECKFTPVGQDRILVQRKNEVRDREAGPSPNAAQNSINSETNPDISPSNYEAQGQFQVSSWPVSSNSDSSPFGWFTRQRDTYEVPHCETDGVTDYCYKGRPGDELLYRAELPCREIQRNKPFGLTLGTGVYWTYSAVAREVIAGVERPCSGSSTYPYLLTAAARQAYSYNYKNLNTQEGLQQTPYLNSPYGVRIEDYKDTFLGKIYQAYGSPDSETLHYANRTHPISWSQTAALALHRPSLDIQLGTLHYPGCRFLTLGSLAADYESDEWAAKPWDDRYSTACGTIGTCAPEPTWLGARLVRDVFGDLVLVYDSLPYRVTGNGLDADIPGLGSHSGGTLDESRVVHTVYTRCEPGHPAITLESTDIADEDVVAVTNPLFNTYSDCQDELYRKYSIDYVDGYPAQVGETSWQGVVEGRHGVTFDALPATAVFLLGDGFLDGSGHRLDMMCVAAGCDLQGHMLSCNMLLRQAPCDLYEDRLEFVPVQVSEESIALHGGYLDGSIKSLFELLPACPKTNMLPLHRGDDVRCIDVPEYVGAP